MSTTHSGRSPPCQVGTPVDGRDVAALHRGSAAVPGVEPGRTGTLVVSRSGRAAGLGDAGIDAWWGPEDVVAAWRS